jgi:serine/threonine-protein kinase
LDDLPDEEGGEPSAADATKTLFPVAPGRRGPSLRDFGDYELLEELGRGGQGVVYRARQKSLNRLVALKVIALGQWASEAHLKRFRLEAETVASLDHPRIVPIYEIGEREGCCFFSMKFVDGGRLDAVLRCQPMPVRRAAQVLASLSRTVHHAHQRGLLHRDIKPANVLLDAQSEPHLTDFGLAKLIEQESTLTKTMDVLGTPSYMSPEQAAGRATELTAATDIYGLGAVLYEMLTGSPPFAGGTTYETIRLVLETEPRRPSLWNPKLDRDVETICLTCLEKDPAKRYASAEALAEDLERWLRHEPISARPVGPLTRAVKWVRRNPAKAVLVPAALLALLGGSAGVVSFVREHERNSRLDSIAVLPFANAKVDSESEYLSDGMAESIISRLSQLPQLRVSGRSTVSHYKGRDFDPRRAGRELGAKTVLSGRVLKQGDDLAVTAELVKVSDGSRLWAGEYHRKLSDLLALRNEIAGEIADKLRLRLSDTDQQKLARRETVNAEAYRHFLLGRFHLGKRTADELQRAVDEFQEAVSLDPNFALAYAGLADTYNILAFVDGRAIPESVSKARASVERALQLDNSLAEAHASLGLIAYGDRRFAESERELNQAIQLNPNYPSAHHWYAITLTAVGRTNESLKEMQRAHELDPVSPVIAIGMATTYLTRGETDLAVKAMEQARELDPNFVPLLWTTGLMHLRQQRFAEAVADFQKAVDASGRASQQLGSLGFAYGAAGKTNEARAVLAELEQRFARGEASAFSLASVCVGLGETDQAFAWLEKSLPAHDPSIYYFANTWFLKPLRDDPRFSDFLKRAGLPPYPTRGN